jgi:hypothetical protein
LTDLTKVQKAVSSISESDLLDAVNVLTGEGAEYSTALPALLTNVIGFVATIEALQPEVTDISAATACLILQQLGLTQPEIECEEALVSTSIFRCAPSTGR